MSGLSVRSVTVKKISGAYSTRGVDAITVDMRINAGGGESLVLTIDKDEPLMVTSAKLKALSEEVRRRATRLPDLHGG